MIARIRKKTEGEKDVVYEIELAGDQVVAIMTAAGTFLEMLKRQSSKDVKAAAEALAKKFESEEGL